jgi:hypothetical protein
VTARGLICSFGLVNGYQLRNPKPPCRRRESETHFFADLLVAQRPAERGSERNVARIDIHHFGQNDRVFIGILGIQIEHCHPGPQSHPVGGCLGIRELTELVQPVVQLPEPRLHELLTLEGRLVFGVFPKVTQLDGLCDCLRQENIQLMAQLVDLTTELLAHLTNHVTTVQKGRPGEVSSPGLVDRIAKDTPSGPIAVRP